MKRYILFIALLFAGMQASAYDDPGLPGDDPDVPLDGGTGLLLLAGAVYGVRKIRKLNNNERQ